MAGTSMETPSTFYSLQLPGQALMETSPGSALEVKQDPTVPGTIFIRHDRTLLIYVLTADGRWSEVHRAAQLFSVAGHDRNYPWDVYGGGLLVVRKTEGIVVYRWSNGQLQQLSVATRYNDVYGYANPNNTVLIGKLFPSDAHIGVLARLNGAVEFRSINPADTRKPVRMLQNKPQLSVEWVSPLSTLSLVDRYDGKPQQSIALRTAKELKLFRFDAKYRLEPLTSVRNFPPPDAEYDRIVFVKFDNATTNDMLHFTTQGLTMYRLNEDTKVFEKVYYSTAFSKLRGWSSRTIETIAPTDLDGDRLDELICSGPKGLCLYRPTFTNEGFDLVNVFDEAIADRFIRYGLPRLVTKGNVLLFTGGSLMSVQTKAFTPKSSAIARVDPEPEKPDPEVSLVVPQRNYIVWLHDTLDLNALLQPLNPHTGTVELSIPLIELPNAFGVSVRKMFQYRNIPHRGCLGRGWSLPLDYIAVERKNSAFRQDHDFAIVKNNNRIMLKPYPHWDSIFHRAYVIEGYKQATIKYFVDDERWEVTMEDRKFVYGRWQKLSTIRKERVCETWPLCGAKLPSSKDLANRWYLVHEETETGQYANYSYDTIDGGKHYRLAEIRLDNESNVRLNYSADNLLASYTVATVAYQQNVFLEYDGQSLVKVRQEDRTLFQFGYRNDRMSKIVYPNGLQSTLDYSELTIDRTRFEEVIPVGLSPSIYYGPDYTVLLDRELEDDRMVLSIRTLLGGTDGPKVMQDKMYLGQPGVRNHMVHALENLLVVVLIYESWKEVSILQYTQQEWVEKQYLPDFPLNGIIGAGKRFVVLCDLKKVQRMTINHAGALVSEDVLTQVPDNILLRAFVNGFVMYTGEVVVWMMGYNDRWTSGNTSRLPNNIFAEVDKFINSFELDAEFRDALRHGLLADALTVHQNAIVARMPVLIGAALEIRTVFLIMNYDRSPREVSKNTVRIPIADFNKYEYTMRTKDGDLFTMYYPLKDNKFTLTMKSVTGPLLKSLEEQKQNSYKQIDASKESGPKKLELKADVDKKIEEERVNINRTVIGKVQFALDLSQFGVLSNQNGVLTANSQLSYDGHTWVPKPISPAEMRLEQVDQMLGDGFRLLKRSHNDTFKVYEVQRNQLAFDTQTNNPQEIQIVAPRYVQAQRRQQPLSVFFFKTGETVTFPANEQLNRASNSIALVTVRNVNDTVKDVIFRPVDSFQLKQTTIFTRQTVRLSQDETRVTGQLYDAADAHLSSEGAMFYRVKVTPGDDPRKYGWYEQATDTLTGHTTRKTFAADGTDVTERGKEKKERQEKKDLVSTIWDRSRQLKVVDLGALRLADEVVSYYGFEPYEQNRYGSDKKWIFNQAHVQLRRGNHHLTLLKGATLQATFTPKDPINMFIVSCWVSSNKKAKLGDVLPVVKVVLTNLSNNDKQTVSGATVRHRVSVWYYVETIIDATKFPRETKLSFDVTIEPSTGGNSIDVDHVRFSPLDLNFRANIYSPVTAELRAMLNNNGMMRQSLYSPSGRRVALLSEYGQVIDFSMHSKTAYGVSIGARASLLEMKPRRGMYDALDDYDWRPEHGGTWSGGNGVLKYAGPGQGHMVRLFLGQFASIALRFLYEFDSDDAKLSVQWNRQEYEIVCARDGTSCRRPPKIGEVLVFITPVRVSVWLEGSLISERLLRSSSSMREFRLVPTGKFTFSEFLVMLDSRVKLTYHNGMGRPVQVVQYDSPRTVRLREILYDDVDRPTMQTKWTKLTYEQHAYFAFNENFITQVDGASHRMAGMVAKAHPSCEGYPFSHTVYANDPTENKQYQGLPGKEYTVTGKYRRRYAMRPEIALLSILFPEEDGFRQKIVERPGKAIRATVEDAQGKKVATYWQVGNYEHRLTTYEYSVTYGYLYRELPPQYHALAKTTSRMRPFLTGGNTQDEMRLAKLWQVSHDVADGMPIRKRTPDGGSYEYIYNEQGILRFTLHYASENLATLDRVIHFTYAANGKIAREALVNVTREKCYSAAETDEVPPSDDLIESTYGEVDTNPLVRYRSQQSTRRIGKHHMIESLIYDEKEKLIKKVFVVPTINTTYSIDYEYENDSVRSVRYPVDSATSSFKLIYGYNPHGEVVTIRESTQRDPMFQYTYNADGMVETMRVRTGKDQFFQRNFTYNEPGFLVKLADDYLTEDVSYVETDSYGQDSYTPIYEGLISRTAFTAHWQRSASALRTAIYPEDLITAGMNREQAVICFDFLKEKGFLTAQNQVNSTFYGELNDDIPFVCGEPIPANHLAGVLSGGSIPYQYGHRYDYDDHDQLIKAKYFHGLDELRLTPLTHRTFAMEIAGVQDRDSKKIWDVMTNGGFVSTDCTNPNLCHGRPGTKSMFDNFIHQHRYYKHLQTMLSRAIAERKGLRAEEFDARCNRWINGSNLSKTVCRDIKSSLTKRSFIGDRPEQPLASLSGTFKDALKSFKRLIPDIVRVLSHHFATALGRSAGDVQSYEIDANGNHRKFYTGFSRYRLEYREGTNQITRIHRRYFDRDQREEEHFNMEHNSDGAVVKAEHKGIKRMEYDRILHRVTKIEMMDRRKLLFQYDVRAERTFKQVLNPDGTVASEKYYIRDANGLVLVDMDMTYLAEDQPPDVRVTSYIYKDQQLVGFVRNDRLYGVITDHEGSVRLVVRDGEVVAAYDYLPYGQLFRRYGTDLDGQLSYLYTGQEWEPETGLYNYRARLYDPDIGRFYQMDPKEQYPSPYVYAGNSPVALVDPDGEFAFALAVFIMAIVGAYLGAASANNCWNPLKWDWRSSSTWLGLLTGAVTGASIPFNMASSVAFFVGLGLSMSTSIAIMVGAGITFAYFTIAASSGTWDPTKFDYSSPGTWNALMNGVATSSWILMNPSSLISSFTTLTSVAAKALFIVAKVTMSLGFTYLFAAISQGGEFDVTKWDFSDPALYMSIIDGFTTATVGLLFARNIPNQMSKWSGKVKRTVDLFVGNSISYRAHMVLGRDWSTMIMHTKNFLYVNFRNMQTLQKGFLTVGFYSVIVSLRVSQMFESPIPEYTAVEASINALFTTEQFSDFIVKPLSPATPKMMLPKPPNVARLLRFRIRSEAITIGNESVVAGDRLQSSASSAGTISSVINQIFRLPFSWLYGSYEYTSSGTTSFGTEVSLPSLQSETSDRSSYMLRNCYQLRNEEYPAGMISCYGHNTILSIIPKLGSATTIEATDRYKHCLPLTYGGHPSVSCDGEWSSFVYTAKESPRVFDLVDGWLLLAQVTPSAYRKLKRAVTYLFSAAKQETFVPDNDSLLVQRTLLHNKLRQLQTQVRTHKELEWARWTMEDLTDDVERYLSHAAGSYVFLVEQMDALQEDIHEAMTFDGSQYTWKDLHQTIENCNEKYISYEEKSLELVNSANLAKHSRISLPGPTDFFNFGIKKLINFK